MLEYYKPGCAFTQAVGQRIAEVRSGLGLTLQSLADRFGCSNAQISQIEKGKRTASVDILEGIAALAGCSVDWLLFGDEAEDARLAAARRLAAEMRKATGDALTLSVEQAHHVADLLEEAGEPRVWAGVGEAVNDGHEPYGPRSPYALPQPGGGEVELPPGVHIHEVEGNELSPLASAGQCVLCVRAAAGEGGPGVVTLARHRWRIVGVLF